MAWVKVAVESDLPEESMKRVTIQDEDIAIYHTADGFFATSDVCTHAGESLCNGSLHGNIVACPKHGGKFDVSTGQATAFPCVYSVATYEVELRQGEVWVDFE